MKRDGLLVALGGAAEVAEPDEVRAAHRGVRARVLGVQGQGMADRLDPFVLAAQRDQDPAQLAPRGHQPGPQLDGAPELGDGLLVQLGHDQVRGLGLVGGAQLEVGLGVGRVEGDRALEEEDRAVDGLVALRAEVDHARARTPRRPR